MRVRFGYSAGTIPLTTRHSQLTFTTHHAQKTRDRRARNHRPVVSRIPWALLDELEHEKYKLAGEKAVNLLFDHG